VSKSIFPKQVTEQVFEYNTRLQNGIAGLQAEKLVIERACEAIRSSIVQKQALLDALTKEQEVMATATLRI
jgi:hypothetical protein